MNKAVRIAGGFTLLTAGTAMLVLPGPGLITIATGLAVLGEDFPWAERLVEGTKDRVRTVLDRNRDDQAGG